MGIGVAIETIKSPLLQRCAETADNNMNPDGKLDSEELVALMSFANEIGMDNKESLEKLK